MLFVAPRRGFPCRSVWTLCGGSRAYAARWHLVDPLRPGDDAVLDARGVRRLVRIIRFTVSRCTRGSLAAFSTVTKAVGV